MTRATSTTSDVVLERRVDDSWNIEGDRDLSDAWTGSTRFTISNETPPGHTWVREAADKISSNIKARSLVARDMEKTCQMQLNEKKNKSGLSKEPKLDNARRLRGIYFIDPAHAEFKETV